MGCVRGYVSHAIVMHGAAGVLGIAKIQGARLRRARAALGARGSRVGTHCARRRFLSAAALLLEMTDSGRPSLGLLVLLAGEVWRVRA